MLTYPSAYALTAATIEEYVSLDEEYVPVAAELYRSWKKLKETEVIVKEPIRFHVYIASYNCSAAAKVHRYQGLPL